MNTYRQLVYMCLDEVKIHSDDSYFEEEHVQFLLDKWRAFLLKQRYGDIRKQIPESNYQEICLPVEETNMIEGSLCGGETYLKSIDKIPDTIKVGNPSVYPTNYFNAQISFVDKTRMRHIGHNKYLGNIIYASLLSDQHLYLKSANPQYLHLDKVRMSAIFSDSQEAAKLACDNDGEGICEVIDMRFPIEDALIPPLIELVVKELLGASYRPTDDVNNANDDLSSIANFIRNNMKQDFNKQIQ